MAYFQIIVLILVSSIIPSVSGCSCLPTSSRNKFCNADFVILARVVSTAIDDTDLGSGKSYLVEVIVPFKGSLIAGQTRTIITAIQGATCGVHLNNGGFYLLAGQENGQELRINLCGWNVEWSSVRQNDKNRLWNGAFNCRNFKGSFPIRRPIQTIPFSPTRFENLNHITEIREIPPGQLSLGFVEPASNTLQTTGVWRTRTRLPLSRDPSFDIMNRINSSSTASYKKLCLRNYILTPN